MLPLELIEACYKVFLGREPENQGVIQSKRHLEDYELLLREFMDCDEFKFKAPPHLYESYLAPHAHVEVDASEADLAAMFQRIRTEWSSLGEQDPYWSVLTDGAYRGETLDEPGLRAFFETGAATAAAVDAFARRAGVVIPDGRCLEFGCGVGRVTGHLARRFREVIAVDISPRNLEICERAMRDQGLTNVTTVLLRSPEDVTLTPATDFLFSTIVLQHNPPPIQYVLLDILLSKILEGGAFLFQVPTNTPNYQFKIEDYLASPAGGMELHDLPMPEVFKLLAKHGAAPLEVRMDGWTGLHGSNSFFGIKR